MFKVIKTKRFKNESASEERVFEDFSKAFSFFQDQKQVDYMLYKAKQSLNGGLVFIDTYAYGKYRIVGGNIEMECYIEDFEELIEEYFSTVDTTLLF